MLKIKDNVDLKELEKFGFEFVEEIKEYVRYAMFGENNDCCISSIRILAEDEEGYSKGTIIRRGETILAHKIPYLDLNIEDSDINDLADLVEKVEESK